MVGSASPSGLSYMSLAQKQDEEDLKLLSDFKNHHNKDDSGKLEEHRIPHQKTPVSPSQRDLTDAMLRHASFQLLDQPRCTTDCVAGCGDLANLPATSPE